MRIRYPLFLIVGFLCAAQSQAAGFFEKSAILGGISVGQLDLNNDNFVTPGGMTGFGAHSTAWNISAGFELNPYLSFEVGRLQGGTATQEKIVTAETTTTATANDEITDVKNYAWHASVIGSWPINDTVSVFARGGILHWQSDIRWNRTDSTLDKATSQVTTFVWQQATASNTGDDPFYGAGFAVNIDSGMLRLEYDLSKINGFDTRNIYLSVVWRFRPW